MPEDPVEQAKRPAVYILAAHDVVAGDEQLHQRVGAGNARSEREPMESPFQCGDIPFERLPRGVFAAGVFVPLVFAERVLHIG